MSRYFHHTRGYATLDELVRIQNTEMEILHCRKELAQCRQIAENIMNSDDTDDTLSKMAVAKQNINKYEKMEMLLTKRLVQEQGRMREGGPLEGTDKMYKETVAEKPKKGQKRKRPLI